MNKHECMYLRFFTYRIRYIFKHSTLLYFCDKDFVNRKRKCDLLNFFWLIRLRIHIYTRREIRRRSFPTKYIFNIFFIISYALERILSHVRGTTVIKKTPVVINIFHCWKKTWSVLRYGKVPTYTLSVFLADI